MSQELDPTENEDTSQEGLSTTATSAGRSAAMMSVLVIISRLTGFVRTWAQAFAMGATILTSCYEVANNLPTQIYELVTAGMLVTAFLPVYLSVKKRLGVEGARDYVSNLTSIALIITGAVTLLSFIFAGQIIWTQSFSAVEDFDSARAVWFFRFFAIEIVLYALSTIFSGVVNAERDYLWSSIAPIFNNVVTIASFLLYGFFQDKNPTLALLILAVGNPLGVAVQVFLQVPSMVKHGIKLRWRIDLKDPALKDTVKIGVPSIVVMIVYFVTSSFQLNALLSVTAIGASISSYALLWYNLPYAVFAVPITTVLFTELSDFYAAGDMDSYRATMVSGASQILFLLVPFGLFLALFASDLTTIISSGRFESDIAGMVALYLIARAPALPVYGVGTYLQKVCSSTRKMVLYAAVMSACSLMQIVLLETLSTRLGLWFIPFTSFIFYVVFDVVIFFALQRSFGHLGLTKLIGSTLRSLGFGALGAFFGYLILRALGAAGIDGSGTVQALIRCAVAGVPAVLVTYGAALLLKVPESRVVGALIGRLLKR